MKNIFFPELKWKMKKFESQKNYSEYKEEYFSHVVCEKKITKMNIILS